MLTQQRVLIHSSSSTLPAVATSSACAAMASFACPLAPSYKASIHLDGTAHIVLAFASWPRHDAILDVEFALGAGLESVAVVGEGATVLRTRFDRGAQVVTFELRGVNAASSGVGGGHHFTFIGRPIEGAARDGGDAGGTTGGWPTAGFAQRPSRGADGNSIDVPAASAAILAAVAVGGVVAAALCLLCFRSGLGGRRAKHRTGSSEERTALTAVLEIPVV